MAFLDAERAPDPIRLVVVREHGEIEALDRQMEYLGGKLESPGARLLF